MTFKDKLILILISILTLGIYPIVIYSKKSSKSGNVLSVETKLSIDVKKMIDNIGGMDNLVAAEYTHTKVKIFFKQRSSVNIDALTKQKGISGVYATSKFVTLIVGPQAKSLCEELNK